MLYLREKTIYETKRSETKFADLTFSNSNIAAWTNYDSTLFLAHLAPYIDFATLPREILEEIAKAYGCLDSRMFWLQFYQIHILSKQSSNVFQRRAMNMYTARRWANRQRNKSSYNAAKCPFPIFKIRMERKHGKMGVKDLVLRKFRSIKKKAYSAQIPIGKVSYLSRKKRKDTQIETKSMHYRISLRVKNFRPSYALADSSKSNQSGTPILISSYEQCEDLPEITYGYGLFSYKFGIKPDGKFVSAHVNKKWLNRHRNRRDDCIRDVRQRKNRFKKQRRSKQRRKDLKFAGAI